MPPSSTFFRVRWPWSSAGAAIEAWQTWAPRANEKITSVLDVSTGPSISAFGQYLGPASDVAGLIAPLKAVPMATLTDLTQQPYMAIQMLLAGCDGKTLAWCHTTGAAPGGQKAREIFQAKSDYVISAAAGGRTRRDDRRC